MLDFTSTLLWLIVFSAAFAIAGVVYARRFSSSLEDYIVARNSQSSLATVLTLMASSLGAWILFAPAQAATWGGLAAVIGYALGAASPRLLMIPLGSKMRTLMPQGRSLTEFLYLRYGKPLHALVLLIMVFYLFIALTAELTAMAKVMQLLAPIPLWVTASVVMLCTLIYTAFGGLRASIFTDKIQMLIIVPLLLVLVAVGWRVMGGAGTVIDTLRIEAPQLINLAEPSGIKAGLTFLLAILLTGIFHQGNWQRVYAAKDVRTMRRGFFVGGVLVIPFIFLMGLMGLAFVAQGGNGDASVALFEIVLPAAAPWLLVALIPLGLSLVMSSADTVISAVSSIVAVEGRRLAPNLPVRRLYGWSRSVIWLFSLPVVFVSAQGYSVLYLFLLADLLCCAAAFPVFYGLYSQRHDGFNATLGCLAGLAAGLWMFPGPSQPLTTLLESFLLAIFVPVAVILVLQGMRRTRERFAWSTLQTVVRGLDDRT